MFSTGRFYPSFYSQPSNVSPKKLDENANRKALEEEGELIETPNFDLERYYPSQVNKILHQWSIENNFSIEEMVFDDLEVIFEIVMHKKHGKIAFFPVTKDRDKTDQDRFGVGIRSLDEVINLALQSHPDKVLSCDKWIMPIAGISSAHFRLLVIRPGLNTAVYYDSKSKIISNAREVILSAKSAYESIDTRNGIVSAIEASVSTFCDNCRYVHHVCETHFPRIHFLEEPLGHQSYEDHINCGPYTVEYARCVAQDVQLSNHPLIPIDDARVLHKEIFSRYRKLNAILPDEKHHAVESITIAPVVEASGAEKLTPPAATPTIPRENPSAASAHFQPLAVFENEDAPSGRRFFCCS